MWVGEASSLHFGQIGFGGDVLSKIWHFPLCQSNLSAPWSHWRDLQLVDCWVLFHSRLSLTAPGVHLQLLSLKMQFCVPRFTHHSSWHKRCSPFSLHRFPSSASSPRKAKGRPPHVATCLLYTGISADLNTKVWATTKFDSKYHNQLLFWNCCSEVPSH